MAKETTNLGRWSEPGVPHKGWECLDVEDLGEGNTEMCGMCGVAEVRFVHIMRHENLADELRCGIVCAGNMEGDLGRAKAREAEVKKKAGRRKRFSSLKWKKTTHGRRVNVRGCGCVILVYKKDGYISFNVKRGASTTWGPRYPSTTEEREVMMRAFDRHEEVCDGRPPKVSYDY
jgi:hypothetical protein